MLPSMVFTEEYQAELMSQNFKVNICYVLKPINVENSVFNDISLSLRISSNGNFLFDLSEGTTNILKIVLGSSHNVLFYI